MADATVLVFNPVPPANALMVVVDGAVSAIALLYTVDEVVGSLPSVV